jgi:hypothetical protein
VFDGDVRARDYGAFHEEADKPLSAVKVQVLQPSP